mmetsp:Transcript_16904/g.14788  ORF Transcript_16904/g.14788 Transcript_16904/m.14788 type:complete len:113 (-) Transcript_16904:309-647(-)
MLSRSPTSQQLSKRDESELGGFHIDHIDEEKVVEDKMKENENSNSLFNTKQPFIIERQQKEAPQEIKESSSSKKAKPKKEPKIQEEQKPNEDEVKPQKNTMKPVLFSSTNQF